jgi:sugar lactone lactonase YvrE
VGVRVLVATAARVGEGPVWDASAGAVHWVDILDGSVHTSRWSDGRTRSRQLPWMVGAAVPAAGGFVLAAEPGFAHLHDDGRVEQVPPLLPAGHRMNDAKCDRAGRLWAGSTAIDFTPGAGTLAVLAPGAPPRTVLDGLTLPNGLGWSTDDRTFHLVDTLQRVLRSYPFDLATGELGPPREVARWDDGETIPDGLAVDAEDHLWIAMWDGGRLERRSPAGDLVATVGLPVRRPTSCAFVGDDFATLCVTSAAEGVAEPSPLDGAVLLVDVGVRGAPVGRFGIADASPR